MLKGLPKCLLMNCFNEFWELVPKFQGNSTSTISRELSSAKFSRKTCRIVTYKVKNGVNKARQISAIQKVEFFKSIKSHKIYELTIS